MAELVVPGAPVTVLIDHGLAEAIAESLMAGGVPTVEKLGAMTPEQLEAIAGIGPEVERIQQAVVSYYGQFENPEGDAPADDLAEVSAAPAEEAAAAAAPLADEPLAEEPEKQSVTIESGEPPVSGGA
jgi:N utilization substance protein A